ncbi:hypothetical protein P700755_001805 [Psychroflexus torquis ATCC 700755]|uniref:Secreted protein n=1 Tax=Psychroflexus torquis (strain ATCC 700755 / CIP 106069 / ACAM 623) TaxID=313595 RepID=K4IE15_PSYTT|nr:hypothetical protein [Psychroflexus torquis]AFU68639.1 hypothetical protein P700755_001805 [Psychroflexus torquis ATCC 700755]
MKNYVSLSLLILVLFSSEVNAQYAGQGEFLRELVVRESGDIYTIDTEDGQMNLKDIEGSPFLTEEFKSGVIINNSKEKSKIKANLRYNIFYDQVEVKYENELKMDLVQTMVLKRVDIYEYLVEGKLFKLYFNDEIFFDGDSGYLEVLNSEDKKIVLFKKYYQNYISAKRASTTYQRDTPPQLITNFTYYISKDSGQTFSSIEADRWDILDSFENNEKEVMKDFIKSNKFKFRGTDKELENELKRTISYYNSL